MTASDLEQLAEGMRQHAEDQRRLLESALPRLDEARRALADQLLNGWPQLVEQLTASAALDDGGRRIRVHGDYHLGQILITEGDAVIIDFEGEPARPLAERRLKASPLRDVAGMLRSYGYAAAVGMGAATMRRPEDVERLTPFARFWESWVGAAFMRAYDTAIRDAGLLPAGSDAEATLLRMFIIDKALYELGYELNNRPDWTHVPLLGLLELLRRQQEIRA
jgi:maltose alpha-D-glucosyltransferase/alpha-amylase